MFVFHEALSFSQSARSWNLSVPRAVTSGWLNLCFLTAWGWNPSALGSFEVDGGGEGFCILWGQSKSDYRLRVCCVLNDSSCAGTANKVDWCGVSPAGSTEEQVFFFLSCFDMWSENYHLLCHLYLDSISCSQNLLLMSGNSDASAFHYSTVSLIIC